jgi:hypothetical protein
VLTFRPRNLLRRNWKGPHGSQYLDGDDDGIARETGRDPVDDQYTPKTPPGDIDNPRDVIPGTGAREVPSTGGPPIVVGALVLLGAALIVGRGVLKW